MYSLFELTRRGEGIEVVGGVRGVEVGGALIKVFRATDESGSSFLSEENSDTQTLFDQQLINFPSNTHCCLTFCPRRRCYKRQHTAKGKWSTSILKRQGGHIFSSPTAVTKLCQRDDKKCFELVTLGRDQI